MHSGHLAVSCPTCEAAPGARCFSADYNIACPARMKAAPIPRVASPGLRIVFSKGRHPSGYCKRHSHKECVKAGYGKTCTCQCHRQAEADEAWENNPDKID